MGDKANREADAPPKIGLMSNTHAGHPNITLSAIEILPRAKPGTPTMASKPFFASRRPHEILEREVSKPLFLAR